MRFGHRPRVADTFCGSGQIPFEAARLGCDVYASDLNPIACMLTWGAFHIVGRLAGERERLARGQQELVETVQAEIDDLGVETDGKGWRAKVFLYCVEARVPQTGWMVPLLPSRVISKGDTVSSLSWCPTPERKRYDDRDPIGVSERRAEGAPSAAPCGATAVRQDPYLIHKVDGHEYSHEDLDPARRLSVSRTARLATAAPVGAARFHAARGRPLPGAPLLCSVDAAQRGKGKSVTSTSSAL